MNLKMSYSRIENTVFIQFKREYRLHWDIGGENLLCPSRFEGLGRNLKKGTLSAGCLELC